MIEDKFALEDESYWTDPWANRKAIQRPLMNAGREGFLIGAPKAVALDRHKTLPVAVLRTRKAQGGSPVDFRASAVIAAWDVEGRRLHARLAFPRPAPAPVTSKLPQAPSGGDSFSGDESAMIGEAGTLNLFARLGLPPSAGDYVLSLLCLNETANRCKTRVIDSAAFQDEAAAEFVRALREEERGPLRPHPAAEGPTSYERDAKSPEIPSEPGIALSVPRVSALRKERSCILRGSFRLPAPQAARIAAVAGKTPTAVVPIGILITGSSDPAPRVINIEAPSFVPLERDGGAWVATGYFAVDLNAHADLPMLAQTCFAYAFSGEIMSGPALAAFVNPVLTWKTKEEFTRETEEALR